MTQIVTPSRQQIFSLQQQERAFYWSRCAKGFFRKHGVIQVEQQDAGQAAARSVIATRNAESIDDLPGQLLIAEGPLSDRALEQLDLAATYQEAEALWLFDQESRVLGELAYPGVTTRAIPPLDDTRTALPEPRLWISSDCRWDNRVIRYQRIAAEGTWRCLALAGCRPDDPQWPVAVSDGRRLVLGLPLFDLIGAAHAFVPLTEGCYANTKRIETLAIERWLIGQFIRHCRDVGQPVVHVADWPNGFTSALTVRHDFDRSMSDGAWKDLLGYYDDRGIRCSIGFPRKTLDAGKAKLAHRSGHEINVHSTAADAKQFADEVRTIAHAVGTSPRGMTAHGGRGGVGFLGDAQYGWLEEAGMMWGELLGRFNGLPFAVNRLAGDVPTISGLMSFPWHYSLDIATKPDAHNLAELSQLLPARLDDGQHVAVMNHPDIHAAELKQLIDSLDLSNTWCATFREVAEWTRAAKSESRVSADNQSITIDFPTPLPASTRVQVLRPDGETIERFCEQGCRRTEIRIAP